MTMGAVPERALTASARSVLAHVVTHGPTTRPTLAAALGLSKPTVSLAVADLERAGLLECTHTTQGPTGRIAAVYALSATSGYVLGVDLGVTRIRVRASRMDGTVLLERERTRRSTARPRLRTMAAAGATHVRTVTAAVGNAHGPLRGIGVAVPYSVLRSGAPSTGRSAELDSEQAVTNALRSAGVSPAVPIHVENNVNCAALAEQHEGSARGVETFAVLQVGVGIGLGLVVAGRLFAGANGVAGEASLVPFPWAPGEVPRHEALEEYLGSEGLMSRVRSAWPPQLGPAPADAESLFDLAARSTAPGAGTARRLVDEHATEVGRLATAVAALLDPGLIVLGGGVGSNPLLLEGVQRVLDGLPWRTRVVTSDLGSAATLIGANRLAGASAVSALLDGTVPVV
jgi:predicted NBD/HSP70 family sugar kinase